MDEKRLLKIEERLAVLENKLNALVTVQTKSVYADRPAVANSDTTELQIFLDSPLFTCNGEWEAIDFGLGIHGVGFCTENFTLLISYSYEESADIPWFISVIPADDGTGIFRNFLSPTIEYGDSTDNIHCGIFTEQEVHTVIYNLLNKYEIELNFDLLDENKKYFLSGTAW